MILRPAKCPRPAATALLLACAALAGCASLSRQPPAGGVALEGTWAVDAAHSDDFDARLEQWLQAHRRKLRERRARYGEAGEAPADGQGEGGGVGQGGREVPPLMMPLEEAGRERTRMADDLRPPARLSIRVAGTAVEIGADDDPVRRLVAGERIGRIDSGGSAEVDCGWEGEAFIVRSRYTYKGQRTWRYERERATGLLRVQFTDVDPEYGRFDLQLRYRPTGP